MTRSIKGPRRAAVLLLGVAATTTLLVSGCGAGQIAETANKKPSVNGVNAQTADRAFKVRNLAVGYLDTKGYPAGGDAPLEVTLYNDSEQPITVRVSTTGARAVVLAGGSPAPATTATSTGAPSASPSAHAATPGTTSPGTASATPTTGPTSAAPAPPARPATGPATIEIPSGGYVILNRSVGSHLQLVGLNEALSLGGSVHLVFEVNGERLEVPAPVAVPLTPVSPAPPVNEGAEGGHE